MADNDVSHEANPGHKRQRTAAESSLAGSAGKGYTKTAFDWAAAKLAAVHNALAKKASQLGKTLHNAQSAAAHLQELKAAEKVPSSLRARFAPAAQAHLAGAPEIKEHLASAEKLLVEAALQQRQQEVTGATNELSAILTGDAFQRAAKDATCFDKQSAKLQAVLEPLITDAEEDFKLAMELAQLDLQQRTAKEKAAAAERAAAKERRSMELDQTETGEVLTRVVEELMEKKFPKLLRKHQPAAVRFDTRGQPRGRKQSPAQRRSRGRSPSRGLERASARRQTPARGPQHPSRGRSASRAPARYPTRAQTPARHRPHTPRSMASTPRGRSQQRDGRQWREAPRADHRQRNPRSTSRPHSRPPINRQGGRGSRPHRSPSAWHGGGGRSGGASGSRMGARR